MSKGNIMQKRKPDEKGFTLIEIIVTLMLVGITSVLAGMWIVSVAKGYVFVKMNADTVQKAQLALTRLSRELSAITSVTASNSTSISYTRTDAVLLSVDASASLNGTALQLNYNHEGNNTLTDQVNAFSLSYCTDNLTTPSCSSTWSSASKIIVVTLTLTGANNTPTTFTRRITPRNL